MLQLKMIWEPKNSSAPSCKLDSGYKILPLSDEKIEDWCELCHPLIGKRWTVEDFKQNMLVSSPSELTLDKIFCIYNEQDAIVATASACFDRNKSVGNLHMVMADKRFRGLGLGKAVCIKAINCFLDNHIEEVILLTDDERLSAIAIYLQLGFRPWLYREDMYSRWMGVIKKLSWEKEVYAYDYKKKCIKLYRGKNKNDDVTVKEEKLYLNTMTQRLNIKGNVLCERICRKFRKLMKHGAESKR